MTFTFHTPVPLFHVYDVPTSVAFYRDVLGFKVVSSSEPFDDVADNYGWAMLQRDEVTLMINNAYEDNLRPSARDVLRTRGHADTILYLVCVELESFCAHMREKSIGIAEPVTTYYGMQQVSVQDPDGYTLCFQRRAIKR